MRNKTKLIGIIAIIIGLSFGSCGDDGGNKGTAPTISTTTLLGGKVGVEYSATLAATGTAPITWSLDSGALPEGLDLAANGVISGMPTTADTYTFTVKASNTAGDDTKELTITIAGGGGTAPDIITETLTDGTVGVEYSATLAATGAAPITWTIEDGALPEGLALDEETGDITGTPEKAGIFNFTVKAANDTGDDTGDLNITIAEDPAITNALVEMVWIKPGTFQMGSPIDEPYRNRYYEVLHEVTLTKGFYMGKYEVTQAQFEEVMEFNPSELKTGGTYASVSELDTADFPVETISWFDTLVFCNRLSEQEGLTPVYTITNTFPVSPVPGDTITEATVSVNWNANGYRLPTDAEWEYACRAETKTAYNTGATMSNSTGWWSANSENRTHSVGELPGNAWDLYDMHGNVSEWCWDWRDEYPDGDAATDPTGPEEKPAGENRVVRGGSFVTQANQVGILRSAYRGDQIPSLGGKNVGFRIVRRR
jgi:formylglycine-generating enzyme required for sulfatase activity